MFAVSYTGNSLNHWDELLDFGKLMFEKEVIKHMYSRPVDFYVDFLEKAFHSNTTEYYGWHISKTEYEKIKTLIVLLPYKLRFEELAKFA